MIHQCHKPKLTPSQMLKTNSPKVQLSIPQTINNQQSTLQNHHTNIKIYTDLQNSNQSLTQTLHQLIKSIQTNLKPQLQSLKKQKAALFKALSYNEKLRLKENFIDFVVMKRQQKNQLLSKLTKLEENNKMLVENLENHNNHQLENEKTVKLLQQQRGSLQIQLKELELKQSVKQQSVKSIKPHNPNPNSPSSDITPAIQTTNPQPQLSLSLSFSSQLHSISRIHPNCLSQSVSYIMDNSSRSSQTESKQIYNSLENELKPLKLNDIIDQLEKQVDTVQNQQLVRLQQEKLEQLRILKQLKASCRHNEKKFRLMKVNLSEFKSTVLKNKLQ